MKPILTCRRPFLFLLEHLRRQRGSAMVEYVILVSLIAMVCLMAVTYLGHSTSVQFSNVASSVVSS